MNHTGVHLLNHAIREHYKSETSIIQMNSTVKNESLKFEFSFNESLRQPNISDIESIENICKQLIQKSLNIYVQNVKNDLNNIKLNYPLRKLKDVLYPHELRVVSIGTNWSNFINSEAKNTDYSAEACCGTHSNNTNQLKEFVITHFNINGDSTFEIDACTSKTALEVIENDKIILNYLNEMIDLSKMKSQCDSSSELNFILHQIADRSIQIENVFKNKKVSYANLHRVKNETAKYRPSKNLLRNTLNKYLEDELSINLRLSKNVLMISNLDPKSNIKLKFLSFDSILNQDLVLSIIKKLKDVYPLLIVYNKYRGYYIFYSNLSIEDNKEINDYYNYFEGRILNQNADASVVESTSNYKILKCPLVNLQIKNKQGYFVF